MLKNQQGIFLLEALIAILIFSFGILGLVGMQSKAISAQSDAQYRIEAANYADKILGQVWLGMDRTSETTVQDSLKLFEYNIQGSNCKFNGGSASGNADVLAWKDDMVKGNPPARLPLPGATDGMQQIVVDTANTNRVTVTVCWQAPFDAAPRRHTMITYVN